MTKTAVSIKGLKKEYAGGVQALKGIDLEIKEPAKFAGEAITKNNPKLFLPLLLLGTIRSILFVWLFVSPIEMTSNFGFIVKTLVMLF